MKTPAPNHKQPGSFDVAKLGRELVRVAPLGFFVLVALIYGFLLLRITLLAGVQPSSSDVSNQVSQLTPHIDQNSVKQLQSLEDNSVNVQTLFNQVRGNPFGE